MCLLVGVPLLESGTSGYLGQTTVIKKVCSMDFLSSRMDVWRLEGFRMVKIASIM